MLKFPTKLFKSISTKFGCERNNFSRKLQDIFLYFGIKTFFFQRKKKTTVTFDVKIFNNWLRTLTYRFNFYHPF